MRITGSHTRFGDSKTVHRESGLPTGPEEGLRPSTCAFKYEGENPHGTVRGIGPFRSHAVDDFWLIEDYVIGAISSSHPACIQMSSSIDRPDRRPEDLKCFQRHTEHRLHHGVVADDLDQFTCDNMMGMVGIR